MKRLLAILSGAIVILTIGGAPLFAQRPHGGGAGGGNSGATGAAMHGASGDHANGSANSMAGGGKSAAASSPGTVLTKNTKLDTHLTNLLQSKGLLAKGTDLKDACSGFKNLGQCVAAMHVSHIAQRHERAVPVFCIHQRIADAEIDERRPSAKLPCKRIAPIERDAACTKSLGGIPCRQSESER